jgi:hypothetical protein
VCTILRHSLCWIRCRSRSNSRSPVSKTEFVRSLVNNKRCIETKTNQIRVRGNSFSVSGWVKLAGATTVKLGRKRSSRITSRSWMASGLSELNRICFSVAGDDELADDWTDTVSDVEEGDRCSWSEECDSSKGFWFFQKTNSSNESSGFVFSKATGTRRIRSPIQLRIWVKSVFVLLPLLSVAFLSRSII